MDLDIENRVLLLAVLKKEESETLNEVLAQLSNNKLFSLKEGKKRLKVLKKEGYIQDNNLTFKGDLAAKEAEAEFTIK